MFFGEQAGQEERSNVFKLDIINLQVEDEIVSFWGSQKMPNVGMISRDDALMSWPATYSCSIHS